MATKTTEPAKFPKLFPGSRFLAKTTMLLLSSFKVYGRENIPAGQFLMTMNHLSYMDAFSVVASIGRRDVAAFMAKKYKKGITGILFSIGSPVWIEQASPDLNGLRTAMSLIEQGYNFSIAPEGHRAKKPGLLPAYEGAAWLASRVDLPIMPVAIWGTERIFKQVRPRACVAYGKPYRLPEKRARGDQLQAITDRIMCAIASMLPEEYRGHYADHPLIEEMGALVRPDSL